MFSVFSDMNHLYSESRSNKIAFMVAHMAFGLSPHSTCTILITFVNMFPVKTVIGICFIRINAHTRLWSKVLYLPCRNLTSPFWQFAEEICMTTQDWAKLEGISCEGHLHGSLLSLKHPFSNSAHQYTKMLLVLKELSKTSSFRAWKRENKCRMKCWLFVILMMLRYFLVTETNWTDLYCGYYKNTGNTGDVC